MTCFLPSLVQTKYRIFSRGFIKFQETAAVVRTKEGDIFGDQVKNIFPKEWDLDFSNNNDFYVSGVKKIEEELKLNNIKTNFVFKEKGQHNETHWNPILREFLVSI